MAEVYTRDASRITVVVGGMVYSPWVQAEVSRSLEALCGTFSVTAAFEPGQPLPIKRQDEVQVLIGSAVVVTGYVLGAEPSYSRRDCALRITGRDRTGDLVRCSAVHHGGQWRHAGLDRIARDLIQPFGLELVVQTDLGDPIQDFKLGHGESVLDALARAARLRGVLVTSTPAGQLLLTRTGTATAPGPIRRGWNVIDMQSIGSDDELHSHYIAYGQSNTEDDFDTARGLKAQAIDTDVKRYLPLIINAEGNTTRAELQALADHTRRVRRGHSLGFRYRVEGWTHQGSPWLVNARVPIYDDVAGLAGDEWLITGVRHSVDLKEGDITELIVRPMEAYDDTPRKSKVVRRRFGNKDNTDSHLTRGPTDGARGGR